MVFWEEAIVVVLAVEGEGHWKLGRDLCAPGKGIVFVCYTGDVDGRWTRALGFRRW